MEDNIAKTAMINDEVAPGSMLAQMLVQPHVAPEEVYASLTNEQLRVMSSFSATSSPYMPDLILNTVEDRTRMPQTPPLPGWVEANPLHLAEGATIPRNMEWTEELKRRKEALKRNAAERAFRHDFSRHISAAMAGKTVNTGPEQLNNGEITVTASHNSGNIVANLRYSQNYLRQHHDSAYSMKTVDVARRRFTDWRMLMRNNMDNKSVSVQPRLPLPRRPALRPALPPPVPDVTITTVVPSPRSHSAPAPASSAVILAPRADSAPVPPFSISELTSRAVAASEKSEITPSVITSFRNLSETPGSYASLVATPTPVPALSSPASIPPVITSVLTLSRASGSYSSLVAVAPTLAHAIVSPATISPVTSICTLSEASGSYDSLVAVAPTSANAIVSPPTISPVITSVHTLSEVPATMVGPTPSIPSTPVNVATISPSVCKHSEAPSTYASLVSVAPTTVISPASDITPATITPVITSVCTLADAPASYASLVDVSPPSVITSTPSVITYPSARLLKMKNSNSTPVVSTAMPPATSPTRTADAGAAATPGDEPYGDNQLLVEVENPEKRKRRSTKRPRLISESGSYVCMEDWEEMVGDDGGEAPDGYEPDYDPGSKRSKKSGRRRQRTSTRDAASTPPRRSSGGSADKRRTRQSFKQRLQAQIQADSGKKLKAQEVEDLFLGPKYDPETLDDSELFQEFVQLVVTKVYPPLPCSRMLLTALQPCGGGRAVPADFFTDLTAKISFPKAPIDRVEHAACLPEESPFKYHVFKELHTKLEEPTEAMKVLYERIEAMNAVRDTITQAAERFRQQFEVVKAFLMPPAVAPRPAASRPAPPSLSPSAPSPSAPRPPAPAPAPPRPRPGPRSVTRRLEARLPVTTREQFVQLNEDMQDDAALRMELLTIYRDIVSQQQTSWECIRGCMARTLAPPVDGEYSGLGRAYKGVAKGNYSATVAYQCLQEAMSERFGDQENMEKLRNLVGRWLCCKKD